MNPNDAANFRFRGTLDAKDSDASASITNFLSWGVSEEVSAGSDQFAGASRSIPVDVIVTDGRLHVACWRDLDKDGVYTEGVDARKTWTFGSSFNGKTLSVSLGDMDADGISDSVEHAEGTDPNASTNYCCSVSVTYTGIFQTTNALTFAALWGTNTVWGPTPVSDRTWSFDFGHRVATHGERASVRVWDDANHNGEKDADETGDTYTFWPRGHIINVTNELPYGSFDRDRDNLPDWWEVQQGLSMGGDAADEYADPDNDGLINLHEFWAGTNPLVPNGSNTLLSVVSRSVDERLVSIDLVNGTSRFVDFFHNASNEVFVVNTNLWCRDVDLSCVSMWHKLHEKDKVETRGTRTATAITRRHVLFSNHWGSDQYRFCDTNGLVVVRNFERTAVVYGDTKIARLDTPLPSSFVPAKVMAADFMEYLGTGKYLPTICVNENQQVVVGEMEDFDDVSGDLVHYGKVAATNVVNGTRDAIRKAVSIGQSSSPVFLLVDNKPVLLLLKHRGYPDALQWNPTWGPDLPFHVERIQQTIDSWEGPGAYLLDIVDVGEFQRIRNR